MEVNQMIELMSNYVSSPSWMGILTLIALIIMLIGVPAMYLMGDDTKSNVIRGFVLTVIVMFVGFIVYGASQQQGNLKNHNFEVKRIDNTLKVTSNTPWLQSKEFTIHSENDEFIYIKDKELYEIKKSELQ